MQTIINTMLADISTKTKKEGKSATLRPTHLNNLGQFGQLVRSFEKGLAGRGGWREEILPMPQIQTSFLCPVS